MSTEAVVRNHLRAATIGVDATYRGRAEIRRFFTALFKSLPAGFFETMKTNREEFVGDHAYLLWERKPLISQATDTFVVRDGKILFQTFTATFG